MSETHNQSQGWSRRGVLGGMVVAGMGVASSLQADESKSDGKRSPVIDSGNAPAGRFDVIVCGGGPAGVSAAVSAARTGAKVHLIENHGCLGGIWTSGMLAYVIDAKSSGFNDELIRRLDALQGRRAEGAKNYVYDIETMKYVLERLVTELGINVQLHTRVVDVQKSSGGAITGVFTESKSGRQLWQAPVVIDTTGDGDVGARAGCEFEIGNRAEEADCPCQPMSLMGVITARPDVLADYDTANSQKNKDRLLAEIERAGITPSYTKPTLWYLGGSIATVMLNHQYAVRPDDAAAVTRATIEARAELFQITRALRALGGRWEGVALVTTAAQIGIRDGRRIKGRQAVVLADVLAGRKRDNSVCTSTFCIDVHGLTKNDPAYSSAGHSAKPFDIPLGALLAADVDGLMMAGRCISGDFFAHASYRVTGNAVATGEAAGITAALAAKTNVPPHQIEAADVLAKLQTIDRS